METASGQALSSSGENFPFIYPGTSQKVAYDTTTQSAALGARTSVVRLIASTDAHVKFGANPTALTDGTSTFLKANIEYFFGVAPGSKIAAIKDSGAGNLFITEGA